MAFCSQAPDVPWAAAAALLCYAAQCTLQHQCNGRNDGLLHTDTAMRRLTQILQGARRIHSLQSASQAHRPGI